METPTGCGRCGHVVEAGAVTVTVDGGPLHASNPLFLLCPHCAERMARWFDKRRKDTSAVVPTADQGPDGKEKGHRRHSRREGKRRGGGHSGRRPKITMKVLAVVAVIMFLITYLVINNAVNRPGSEF